MSILRKRTEPKGPKGQRGAAALLVTVLALLLITMMTLYSSRVGVMDQRMSANDARYKQAFADAQSNLDTIINQWSTQTTTADRTATATNGSAMAVRAKTNFDDVINADCTVTAGATAMPTSAYVGIACAQGESDDGTGTVTVSREITLRALSPGPPGGPDAPIIASGSVGSGGGLSIVTNSNGGGPGVPVSAWSADAIPITGSIDTCHAGEFGSSGGGQESCIGEILSGGPSNISGADVIPNDTTPPFPEDVFEYAFGVKTANYEVIKNMAVLIDAAGECASMESLVSRVYWVSVDCSFTNDVVIGATTFDAATGNGPVIIVIDEGASLGGNGGATINGIVFVFDNPDKTDIADGLCNTPGSCGVDFNGGATLNGSLLANTDLDDHLNGTFNVVYNQDVFDSFDLKSNAPPPNSVPIAYIAGTWKDFQ